jgi:hypothetical protein
MAVRPPSEIPSSNISSEVAWAAMMLWRAAALMATTFCMTGSHWSPLGGVSLGKLIVSERFGMSAPEAENGFMLRRIVSSLALRRNNWA